MCQYYDAQCQVIFGSSKMFLVDCFDDTYFCFRFFFIHLFTCSYIVWVISTPYLLFPYSPPESPSLPGRTCSALISNFVEEKT
jgi:hypothetical protein